MSRRVVPQAWVACLAGLLVAGGTARAQTGIIRATVVDSAGAPITGAAIDIFVLQRSERTDSLGKVTFTGLSSGDVDVSVRHLGYKAQTWHMHVTLGRPMTFTAVLAQQVVSI